MCLARFTPARAASFLPGAPMKLPRSFFKPLAIGAPMPLRELPVRLERMIHFVPPHLEKLRAEGAGTDRAGRRGAAAIWRTRFRPTPRRRRGAGFIEHGQGRDFGATGLWTRINALNSPVGARRHYRDRRARSATSSTWSCCPKVEGPWDIHYLDQLLAQLEAQSPDRQADPHPCHPGNRRGGQQCRRRSRPPRRGCTASVSVPPISPPRAA